MKKINWEKFQMDAAPRVDRVMNNGKEYTAVTVLADGFRRLVGYGRIQADALLSKSEWLWIHKDFLKIGS